MLVPMKVREQQAILQLFDAIRKNQQFDQEHLNKLRSLKTGLMQDLLTGKVRVSGLLNKQATNTPSPITSEHPNQASPPLGIQTNNTS